MNANKSEAKTKLIIFDFDGTLSVPDEIDNSWARIWIEINLLDEDIRLYNLYKDKQITYKQWVDEIIKIYRENKVNSKTFSKAAKKIHLLNNCKKVFKFLYQNDIKICILSGGVKNIIEEKVKKFRQFITEIEAETLTLDNDGVVNGIILAKSNVEDKSNFVLNQIKKYNLKKEEVIFVGNSYNDEEVYKSGVTTICLNPVKTDYTNKKIWTHYLLNVKDLRDILKFVNL